MRSAAMISNYFYIRGCIRPGKKTILVLVIGRVNFDENKNKMRAAKYNKTLFSPVDHRRSRT